MNNTPRGNHRENQPALTYDGRTWHTMSWYDYLLIIIITILHTWYAKSSLFHRSMRPLIDSTDCEVQYRMYNHFPRCVFDFRGLVQDSYLKTPQHDNHLWKQYLSARNYKEHMDRNADIQFSIKRIQFYSMQVTTAFQLARSCILELCDTVRPSPDGFIRSKLISTEEINLFGPVIIRCKRFQHPEFDDEDITFYTVGSNLFGIDCLDYAKYYATTYILARIDLIYDDVSASRYAHRELTRLFAKENGLLPWEFGSIGIHL